VSYSGDNAIETNLEQVLGTDHDYVMTDTDGEDLSAATLSFMVKRVMTDIDANALLTLTGDSPSRISIDVSEVTVSILAEDIDALVPGTYFWELKRLDVEQNTVLGRGRFRLLRGVHRDYAA
jgi:hypothetical protein